jgi:hypothetical protein
MCQILLALAEIRKKLIQILALAMGEIEIPERFDD